MKWTLTTRCYKNAGASVLTLLLLSAGVSATAAEGGWDSFCNEEKNYSICYQADVHCENQTHNLSCADIRKIMMRYRGLGIAHLKAARKDSVVPRVPTREQR